MFVFRNRMIFVGAYLLFVLPTYILPYTGSNSAVLNAAGAASGLGALPQFWYHLAALYALVAIGWLRGATIGKAWIAILPFLAGIFDMVPGLNLVPLVPTGLHCVTLVMGVKDDVISKPLGERRRYFLAAGGLAIFTILAVGKTLTFRSASAVESFARYGAESGISKRPEQPHSSAKLVDRDLKRTNPARYSDLVRAHRYDLLPALNEKELRVARFGLDTATKLLHGSFRKDVEARVCPSGTIDAGLNREDTIERLIDDGLMRLHTASPLWDPKVIDFDFQKNLSVRGMLVSSFGIQWIRKPLAKNDLSDLSVGFYIVEIARPWWQFWGSDEMCVVHEGGLN